MKKIVLVLLSIVLIGCQNSKQKKAVVQKNGKKEDLVIKNWRDLFWKGNSNEDGYYLINHDGENSYLCYYDYSSKQEVYLCDKPECQHKDESCTAYLAPPNLSNMIFVYKDHLYMIQNYGIIINSLGERTEDTAKIIQMDLDGKNRHDLCKLDEGYEFEYTSLVLGNESLYIPVTKTKNVEMKKNNIMSVVVQKKLYQINLKSGEAKNIMDMKYKDIIGVNGQNIIMTTMSYSEDPQKYLDQKNYQKYDQILMNGKYNYETYNLETKKTKTMSVKLNEQGYYYQNKSYYTKKDGLYSFDFQTNQETKVINLDKNKDYNITFIVDDYVILNEWKDNFIKSYKVSLKNPKLEELKQYLRTPKEPVNILAQTKDQLLVLYDREGHDEKTWAGTMQYETTKEYIGLISIDDFLQGKRNYQQIKTLNDKRRE